MYSSQWLLLAIIACYISGLCTGDTRLVQGAYITGAIWLFRYLFYFRKQMKWLNEAYIEDGDKPFSVNPVILQIEKKTRKIIIIVAVIYFTYSYLPEIVALLRKLT